MEAARRWSHYLYCKRFDLVTDQRALSFILSKFHKGKVKNNKIQLWKAELSSFDYRIRHRPGKLNVVPDALSRTEVSASLYPSFDLKNIHCIQAQMLLWFAAIEAVQESRTAIEEVRLVSSRHQTSIRRWAAVLNRW